MRLVGYAADAIPQGSADHVRGPVPTVRGFLLNAATGAALLWLVPRLLPAATTIPVRFWIGLVGISFLGLIARFDFYALIFGAMGFAVEKLWDCPIGATSLGDFWGRRWNRIVSGVLREVNFYPVARRAGAGRPAGGVPLQRVLPRVRQLHGPRRLRRARPLLPAVVPRSGGREHPPRPPPAPGPALAWAGLDRGRSHPARWPVPPPRARQRLPRADACAGRCAGTRTLTRGLISSALPALQAVVLG
jgi:hypothetical protein